MKALDNHEQQTYLHFSLTHLLSAGQELVVSPALGIVSLLSTAEAPHMLQQKILSPYGMAVLLPLLQSSPHYCPYERLLSSLYPYASLDECRRSLQAAQMQGSDAWETAIRPVRRAISTLKVSLADMPFSIKSVSGLGYLLLPRLASTRINL